MAKSGERFLYASVQQQPEEKVSAFKVHLALITTQCLFGAGSIVGRLGLHGMNPVVFALIREGFAGPILCAFAYFVDKEIPKITHFLMFFVPGMCLFSNQLFFLVGEKLSSATEASAWQPSQPVMTAFITICLGMEEADLQKILGILFATGGALFIVLYGASFSGNSPVSEFAGHICFFLNCLGTALYVIVTKRWTLRVYPSATVTGYSYITATFGMLATALLINNWDSSFHFVCSDCENGRWYVPPESYWAIAYWIIGNSCCAYFFMTWANQHADATIVMAYSVLQPVTSIILSQILIHLGAVNECVDDADTSKCLHGLKMADLGAIGIAIGLFFVIRSDVIKRRNNKSLDRGSKDSMNYVGDSAHENVSDRNSNELIL